MGFAILLCIIIFGGFAAFIIFCFYKAYTSAKEQRETKEKYNPIYNSSLKHTSGLPLASGAIVKVCYCKDRIVFVYDKQEITILRDKITSIDCVTGKDIKAQQAAGAAAGKYLFGGLTGAFIGSLLATSTYLVISYKTNEEYKSVVLDTYVSGTFANKVQKDFKRNTNTIPESIEL